MFTKGRLIFAAVFALVFIAVIIWSYRKDIQERAENFKGSKKTLLIILFFLVVFLGVIQLLKFI